MSASLSSRALGQPGLLLRPSVSARLASSRPSSLASFSSSPVILSTHLRTSVASLYLSSSSAPSSAVRQLRLARDPLAFSSPAASLRSLSTSPRRVDSPKSESKDGSTRFTRPEEDHDEEEPRNPSISQVSRLSGPLFDMTGSRLSHLPFSHSPPTQQKFKALSRKYGWWAFGVYNALSLIDFSIAFAGVQYLGAERVVAVEAAVVGWVYDRLGWERREPLSEEGEGKKTGEVSIYTKVALVSFDVF